MLTIYEIVLLFRHAPKDELAANLKRTINFIFSKNGFLRRLDYMGHRQCPWRQTKNGKPYWDAEYFFSEFSMPKIKVTDYLEELSRDADVIRFKIHSKNLDKPYDIDFSNCTFHEEMLPVPYRPAVVELVQKAKSYAIAKKRNKFQLKTSMDYYPFKR